MTFKTLKKYASTWNVSVVWESVRGFLSVFEINFYIDKTGLRVLY